MKSKPQKESHIFLSCSSVTTEEGLKVEDVILRGFHGHRGEERRAAKFRQNSDEVSAIKRPGF